MDKQTATIIAKALQDVFNLEGFHTEKDLEIFIRGKNVDNLLLIGAMAKMLEAGDLELSLVGDKSGKATYFNKLIKEISET